MKKLKFLILVVLSLFVMFLFSSCFKVTPESKEWHLTSCTRNISFINGVSQEIDVSTNLSILAPYTSIHSAVSTIDFREDGTVIFKPVDCDEIGGTYTYTNNSFEDRSQSVALITVTLDNGDEFKANIYQSSFNCYNLDFEYNGIKCSFSDQSDAPGNEDEMNELIKNEIIDTLRSYQQGSLDFETSGLEKASVRFYYSKNYIHIPEKNEMIEITDELAIYAVQITNSDEFVVLDELKEGECFASLARDGIVTLYYLDQTPSNSDTLMLSEIEPWLKYDASKVIQISIEDHYIGSCVGTFGRFSDPYYVRIIAELLQNMEIHRITDEEAENIDTSDGTSRQVYFYYTEDGLPIGDIHWVNGYVQDENGVYYRCDGDFPNAEFTTDRLMQALKTAYPKAIDHYGFYSLPIDTKYVWPILYHTHEDLDYFVAGSETVAGFTFNYIDDYHILLFFHDRLYSLTEAYEEGVITDNDVRQIFLEFSNRMYKINNKK